MSHINPLSATVALWQPIIVGFNIISTERVKFEYTHHHQEDNKDKNPQKTTGAQRLIRVFRPSPL
jgi:hypothetical protein